MVQLKLSTNLIKESKSKKIFNFYISSPNQDNNIHKIGQDKRRTFWNGPLVGNMMLYAFLFLSSFFLVSNDVFAQTRSAPTANFQKSQNWSSFTFQGQRVARMVTSAAASSGDTFYMMLDMEPPCKNVNLRLSLQHQPAPLKNAVQLNWLVIMRPDGISPIGGHVTYNGKVGDQYAIFTLNALPEFPQLFQRMVAGQFVRTHLGNQDGKILAEMVFSLYGFTASYNRILSLCRQML